MNAVPKGLARGDVFIAGDDGSSSNHLTMPGAVDNVEDASGMVTLLYPASEDYPLGYSPARLWLRESAPSSE